MRPEQFGFRNGLGTLDDLFNFIVLMQNVKNRSSQRHILENTGFHYPELTVGTMLTHGYVLCI